MYDIFSAFELAELPLQACVKQKSHTRCARSVLIAPPRSRLRSEHNGAPSAGKRGTHLQTQKDDISFGEKKTKITKHVIVAKQQGCCCGRTDPLIARSTLSSSASDN